MGYSYQGNKLCCQLCSTAGGVRKHRCPHGWCQPVAACAPCWKEKRAKLRAHCNENCAAPAARYAEENRRRQELLDSGHYVRVAATSKSEEDLVKVWFRDASGAELVLYMDSHTYRAIPLATPATPSCYRKHGELKTEREIAP